MREGTGLSPSVEGSEGLTNERSIMRRSADEDRRSPGNEPEDQPQEPGAQGGSETAKRSKLPFMPDEKDDSAVGDTDQHSTA